MKIPALVLAALLIHTLGFAQAAQPQTQRSRLIPPEPRDGEGTATTVVPILIYHSIRPYIESDTAGMRRYIATPQALDEELGWLRQNGYASISFDDLVNHVQTGAALPPKPVILSFDDDWENQYRYALPLLKKYDYSATFYIWVVVVGMKHHMTWDEIRELAQDGMRLGCHTFTHPYLTRVQDGARLEREIVKAKKIIEDHTGVSVTTLAYPFGQYDARIVAAVKAAGFTSARSTWPGVVHSKEGLFSLTGLIRTESEKSLVDTMQKYLAAASETREGEPQPAANEGVAGAAGFVPAPSPPSTGLGPGPDPVKLPLKAPARQLSQ